jgi:hypothetical protein
MAKCFFILKSSPDAFEASLGLAYFDAHSAETAVDRARRIAEHLREHRPYRACSVIVMEQSGREIARVPVTPRERSRKMPTMQLHKLVS